MPGADAEVIVLDPELEWEIDPASLICPSGEEADLELVDDLCTDLFTDVQRITDWIGLARTHVTRQGLAGQIAWLGRGERTRLGLAVNQAVADLPTAG
jgi:urocanate hydratase